MPSHRQKAEISALTGGSYYCGHMPHILLPPPSTESSVELDQGSSSFFLELRGLGNVDNCPVFVGCQHRNTGKLNIGARARRRLDILLSVPTYTCAKPPSTNNSVPVM
jgi:hypothetical protein